MILLLMVFFLDMVTWEKKLALGSGTCGITWVSVWPWSSPRTHLCDDHAMMDSFFNFNSNNPQINLFVCWKWMLTLGLLLWCPLVFRIQYVVAQVWMELIYPQRHTLFSRALGQKIVTLYHQWNYFLFSYFHFRSPQNQIHPVHGGPHSGGHVDPWSRASQSHHPHFLWYDAVWVQFQWKWQFPYGKRCRPIILPMSIVNSYFLTV